MADQPRGPPVGDAAKDVGAKSPVQEAAAKASTAAGQAKKALPKQNEAFRMMGLPRIRLPSRNWSIFLGITGSFLGAVYYDKWQARLAREKWCKVVSHIAEESLPSHTLARKVTVYLAAPPGDGLRAAREHFHAYIKPVLVAAAMDWDVVEGRKEGDVRWKTAERVRKQRRRGGEGTPEPEEEMSVEGMRQKAGTQQYEGVAGDLVVGRNTWKEYVRGLHEGWLGPADGPLTETPETKELNLATRTPGLGELGDAVCATASSQSPVTTLSEALSDPSLPSADAPTGQTDEQSPSSNNPAEEDKKDEASKPRHPPAYITPDSYQSATLSALTPSILGPSVGIQFPHILGFRNTPIRMYRFLNRRRVADDIGRQVAAAVFAVHRPYETTAGRDELAGSEVQEVLKHEESNWWKTTYKSREPHEEAVWVEDCIVDERLTGRMRKFELSAEDEDRAKSVASAKWL